MVQSCQVECSRFQPQRAEQKYNQEIEASLTAAQQIVDDVFVSAPKPNFLRRKLVTLEVYAGVHSPLTSCLQDLGAQAYRFTKLDGDLSTFSGRQKLWKLIDSVQPDHIFVAPRVWPLGWMEPSKCSEKCSPVESCPRSPSSGEMSYPVVCAIVPIPSP